MTPVQEQTFNDYLAFIHPKVKALAEETVHLMRYLLAVCCEDLLNGVVLTSDWFWGTRGHTADNGSGTICEWKTGGIVAFKHYCKRVDKMSDIGGFEYTSKAMDAMGFSEMMDEFIDWMEDDKGGLGKLIEDYELELDPKLDGFVLDGDSSTDVVVDAKKVAMRPDARLAEAVQARAAKGSKYCGDMRNRACCNHLAKNCGKAALAVGQKWHT
eukprot:3104995-Prymnesium_polylepis.1